MHTTASLTLTLLFTAGAAVCAGGIVVDPTGRPIPAARVECASESAVTGPDGRFTIAAVACRAVVSAAGFQSRTLDLAGAEARIELALPTLSERVVVSATRRQAAVEEAGVSGDLVSRADLERRQYPALGDLLREEPGIAVARYGRPGSLTQIFTRGGARTGTLVLIDGVPVNDPGGEINLAGFTTTGLDRVEVVRGPESALFGAEAASGVVQLFTARGDPESRLPRGSLSYERGSFQTDRWTANVAGGSGARLDYSLSADQFHTLGEYTNDWFRNTTGTANVGMRLAPSTELRGIFRTFDAFAGVPNQVGYGILDRDANEATRDTLGLLRLEDVRGPGYVQHISFAYRRSHDLFVDSLPDGPYDVAALVRDVAQPVPRVYLERLVDPALAQAPPGLRLVTQSITLYPFDPYLTLSSRKQFDYQGTLAHSGGAAVFGYEYERQDANVSGREVGRDNHGMFFHEQRVLAGRLFLSGGVRVERNSAFGTRAAPRGAAAYRLGSSTFVRASAGLGITAPSLLQNYTRDAYTEGNPALRPEKTASYEVGLAREWLSRRLRTEVSAFHNSFRDLIVFVPLFPVSTWQNIERSRARGLEFSAQARLASLLLVSGNYTKMWTRITRSNSPGSPFTGLGQELARRPGNSGAASLALTPRRWSFEAGAVFVGERQDQDYIFGVTRNRGYQSLWAGASLRVHRNLMPYLRLENLLNSHYQEVLGYPTLSRAAHGGLRAQW